MKKEIRVYRDDTGEEVIDTFDPRKYRPYMSTDGTLLIIKKHDHTNQRVIKKAYARGIWNTVEDDTV